MPLTWILHTAGKNHMEGRIIPEGETIPERVPGAACTEAVRREMKGAVSQMGTECMITVPVMMMLGKMRIGASPFQMPHT